MSLTTVEAHLRAALAACDFKGTRLLVARFLWRVLYAADPRPALERIAECVRSAAAATREHLAKFAEARSWSLLPSFAIVGERRKEITAFIAAQGWGDPTDLKPYHAAMYICEQPIDDPVH